MDCTVYGIFQARILNWVAFPFSRGIFPTQGSNPGLPHCRRILYQLSHQGSPRILEWVAHPMDLPDPGIEPGRWILYQLSYQRAENLPTVQETWVRSLGREDPLEKGMKTHSSILGWEIPWTEEPGGLQSMGSQRVRHNWETNHFTFFTSLFYRWGNWAHRY